MARRVLDPPRYSSGVQHGRERDRAQGASAFALKPLRAALRLAADLFRADRRRARWRGRWNPRAGPQVDGHEFARRDDVVVTGDAEGRPAGADHLAGGESNRVTRNRSSPFAFFDTRSRSSGRNDPCPPPPPVPKSSISHHTTSAPRGTTAGRRDLRGHASMVNCQPRGRLAARNRCSRPGVERREELDRHRHIALRGERHDLAERGRGASTCAAPVVSTYEWTEPLPTGGRAARDGLDADRRRRGGRRPVLRPPARRGSPRLPLPGPLSVPPAPRGGLGLGGGGCSDSGRASGAVPAAAPSLPGRDQWAGSHRRRGGAPYSGGTVPALHRTSPLRAGRPPQAMLSEGSIRSISASAPCFESGSLRLPHFGDCTQHGQPSVHGQSRITSRASRTSAAKSLVAAPVMPMPPGWPS